MDITFTGSLDAKNRRRVACGLVNIVLLKFASDEAAG